MVKSCPLPRKFIGVGDYGVYGVYGVMAARHTVDVSVRVRNPLDSQKLELRVFQKLGVLVRPAWALTSG